MTLYNDPNAATLFQIIATELASELGTFANGKRAITIEPPTAPKPGSGLHVFISRYGTQLTNKLYQYRVSMVMVSREETDYKTFDLAIRKMRQKFPQHREVMIANEFSENRYPQVNYLICVNQSITSQSLAYLR